MQQEALCTAITDIIWKAGGGLYGVVCLPHPNHSHLEDSDLFNKDGKISAHFVSTFSVIFLSDLIRYRQVWQKKYD